MKLFLNTVACLFIFFMFLLPLTFLVGVSLLVGSEKLRKFVLAIEDSEPSLKINDIYFSLKWNIYDEFST